MSNEKLSRRQRRFRERLQDEVSEVSQYLGDAFLHFFTTAADPEGPAVVEKMDQIDRQWRIFCSTKRLQPAAYSHMKEYMSSLVTTYIKMKEQKTEVVKND